MSDQSGSLGKTAKQLWEEAMAAEKAGNHDRAAELRREAESAAMRNQEGRPSLREKGQGKER